MTAEQRAVYNKTYRANHLEALKQSDIAYHAANREARRQYSKRYYAANREKWVAYVAANPTLVQERNRAWRAAHLEYAKAEYKAWARDNVGRINAKTSRRRIAQIRATPQWSNDGDAIEAIYRRAADLSADTGVQHDVDHVYPLQGKTVSGLHVSWNLQILTHVENMRKKNKHPDGCAR